LGPSASALGLTGSALRLAVLGPRLTAPDPSGLDIWLSSRLCPVALGLCAEALRLDVSAFVPSKWRSQTEGLLAAAPGPVAAGLLAVASGCCGPVAGPIGLLSAI